LITFSLNDVSGSDTYAVRVWTTINSNLGYFKKFNNNRWEEAVQKTYVTALEHRDSTYGDNILPYIKKLARTILKVKQTESAFGVYTDDGEISPIFYSLRDFIDTENLDGADELKDTFKELYLMDSESFLKLKQLFQYNDIGDVENIKAFRVRNTKLSEEFRKLVVKHGADYTFRALYDFFNELPTLIAFRNTGSVKEVTLKGGNFSVVEKIPDTALIQDIRGNYHYIDKNTLTMDENPDYIKWDIVGTSLCDILKVDISAYINHMYEEVFVDQGVNTRHISWCGNKYKLVTPGGVTHICLEQEKFMSVVRIELILNLMMNNIGSIVAISPDNVYIKPTRAFQFDKVRLKFQTGKILDLPITVHIKKRKGA
jgi:hypothetical protein